MTARRDWTEAEARAWLRASKPRGWWQRVLFEEGLFGEPDTWRAEIGHGRQTRIIERKPTLRAACKALVLAAKRAGINVNAAPEPQGGGR